MKSKKTVFAAVLTLVLALSIVTVSATAASANVKKSGEPVNDPCMAAAEVSGECVGQPLEGFIKNLSFLSANRRNRLCLQTLPRSKSMRIRSTNSTPA